MKKELAVFTLALGLASTAPAFAGEEKITPKKQPVKMTVSAAVSMPFKLV
jgi:hypothetical protein